MMKNSFTLSQDDFLTFSDFRGVEWVVVYVDDYAFVDHDNTRFYRASSISDYLSHIIRLDKYGRIAVGKTKLKGENRR